MSTDSQQGLRLPPLCLWLTGLPSSGKTTTASALMEVWGERAIWLDGDKDSQFLSGDRGFSSEDRDFTGRRTAWVASLIVRAGGLVICSTISPYRATRAAARRFFEPGQFWEIFIDAPLEICRQRDVKGLYQRAQRGEIRNLTGHDDPYEAPLTPELHLDAFGKSVTDNVRFLRERVERLSLFAPPATTKQ